MILITAAAGTIGSNLTYILAHAKVPFRAQVHHRERVAPAILDLELDLVEADFSKPETLAPALEGVTTLFLNSPGDNNLVEYQANVIDQAKRAGVQHVIKLSTIGAAPNAIFATGRWHFEVEQRLEASGLKYTHLRSHSLMQNFFNYAPFIRQEGAFIAPMGSGKIPLVDVRDIATVAAILLTSEGHEGMIYEVTGPEAITYQDTATAFTKVLGRPIRYIDIPLAKTREAMVNGEWPEWMIDDVLSLYKFFREGNASQVTDTIEKLMERPATSFEQFVRDYAGVFTEQTEPNAKPEEIS